MDVSREKAPTAQETFMQMAQAAGLRGRILVTIGLLILVRLGVHLPVPGIDRVAFAQNVQNSPLIGFLDLFSGGGLSALGIFALGILPYINASIIVQLLTAALPSLEDLQKNEGEAGRRKISQITRYVSLGWAILQSIGIAIWVSPFAQSPGAFIHSTNCFGPDGRVDVCHVGVGIGDGARHRERSVAADFYQHCVGFATFFGTNF
jgi:preprotein translocase subunit SecY